MTEIKFSTDEMDSTQLEITMVKVNPSDRGKGKGTELVQSAIEYARDNGYKSVGLYAYAQDDDGLTTEQLIDWYKSLGFESNGDDDSLMTYYL